MNPEYNFFSDNLCGIISESYDTEQAREMFRSLDELIEHPERETLLLDRNRIEKVPVTIEGKSRFWVIKKFTNRGLYKKLVYSLRSSKAKRSYLRACRLVANGFGTPVPIGCVEKKKGLFLIAAYYITEFLEYDFDVRSYFRGIEPHCSGITPEKFYRRLGRFARKLHSKGFHHADFTDGNILVTVKTEECHFSLVDLNRICIKKRIGLISGIRGIVKLNFPPRYRLYLLQGYCGESYRPLHLFVYRVFRLLHVMFRDAKKPPKRLRNAIKGLLHKQQPEISGEQNG